MADEETTETTEEVPAIGAEPSVEETPVVDAPAEATPADEAPAADGSAEATPAEEAAPGEAPATEPAAPSAGRPAPITSASTPTQRKRARDAARLAAAGTRPTRTAEERQSERDDVRAKKAVARRRERDQARAKYQGSEHERVPTPAREHVVGLQKTRQGIVVSDKAAKTITVRIDVARPHRKYKKIIRTSMTLHAHDEQNDAHVGDTVVVQESRPLSATKRWRLMSVVERAK